MLTNEDIAKIVSIVATKEDVNDLKQDINNLREMVQSLVISIDKLVKLMEGLNTEYVAMVNQMNRHEKWIQKIAQKVGVSLEY